MLQGVMAVGLCYGGYKAAPYVSEMVKQKWIQYRRARVNIGLIEEEKKISLMPPSYEDNEKLKEFIESYNNEDEKKNGASELIGKLNTIVSDSMTPKTIDYTDQKFKTAVLNNEMADEMLASLSFEKEGTVYKYVGKDTTKLKRAIKYFEKFI